MGRYYFGRNTLWLYLPPVPLQNIAHEIIAWVGCRPRQYRLASQRLLSEFRFPGSLKHSGKIRLVLEPSIYWTVYRICSFSPCSVCFLFFSGNWCDPMDPGRIQRIPHVRCYHNSDCVDDTFLSGHRVPQYRCHCHNYATNRRWSGKKCFCNLYKFLFFLSSVSRNTL